MNTKLILLSIFTVLYFLGTQWWYSNKISGVCCGGEKVEEVVETPAAAAAKAAAAAAAKLPLAFKWDNAQPILGDNYKAYVDNTILKGMEDGKVLQITGYYYKDEGAQEGFDNAGLARAAAIREMLKESIASDRVDISSRLANDTETMKDLPFEGASYNWRAELKKEETTIVEVDNESTIYFPFNSSVRDKNAEVDEYLSKLAERLKQNTEKVSIVGHTDNVGEETANYSLGMSRAESIRAILIGQGIAKDRISIDSKGETQPATSNDTENGRHRNRRTVLRIQGS